MKIQHYIASIVFVLGMVSMQGQQECFPKRADDKNKLVYDESDKLTDGEENQLNRKLASFAAQTSNQIVVVIVDDICGDAPWHYATELGHAWGVGQDKFDNGIVILVKPSGGQGQRKSHIAVGYGLGGAIPDITAKQIVERELIPNFANGSFYKGLDEGTSVLMSLAQGEYNSDAYAQKASKPLGKGVLIWVIIMFFFVISRFVRAKRYADLNDIAFWTAFWMLSSSGRSHSGSWGSFSGGSGGFGGGGGGFGGFGGGGFGGGGAGGSW